MRLLPSFFPDFFFAALRPGFFLPGGAALFDFDAVFAIENLLGQGFGTSWISRLFN